MREEEIEKLEKMMKDFGMIDVAKGRTDVDHLLREIERYAYQKSPELMVVTMERVEEDDNTRYNMIIYLTTKDFDKKSKVVDQFT